MEADGQLDAVTIASARHRGVVVVGACYGAWTLDTVQEPVHKTAENSLALAYLRSGTRAFVADTHLSYSVVLPPTGPYIGRSGFELVFWRAIASGATPIDAFQESAATIVRLTYPNLVGGERQVERRTDFGIDRYLVVYTDPKRAAGVRISIVVATGTVEVASFP